MLNFRSIYRKTQKLINQLLGHMKEFFKEVEETRDLANKIDSKINEVKKLQAQILNSPKVSQGCHPQGHTRFHQEYIDKYFELCILSSWIIFIFVPEKMLISYHILALISSIYPPFQRIVIVENIYLVCLLDKTADFGVKTKCKVDAALPAAGEEQT